MTTVIYGPGGAVKIRDATTAAQELKVNANGSIDANVVGGGGSSDATEATLQLILAELTQKLEAGEQVALDAATLAALETITAVVSGTVAVSNMIPAVETGLAKEATLQSLLTELQAKLEAGEEVALDAATIAAIKVISGAVSVTNFPATFPDGHTQPLTDTQLRATAVPISGTVATTGGLTDTELRATPVPVATGLTQPTTPADTQPVSAASLPLPTGAATAANQQTDALTDGQLRAAAVPVSAATLPLPAGAATSALQQTDALTDTQLRATAVPVATGLVQPTTPSDTQPVSAASLPLPAGAATAANQQTDALTDTELRATPVPVSGTVTTGALTDAELRAADVPVAEATKVDLLTYAEIRTASDTITPAAGKRIEVIWVQVIPSSDNSSVNPVTIQWDGGTKLYEVYAVGRSAKFVGDADQALNITLANAQPVSINIQYREVD